MEKHVIIVIIQGVTIAMIMKSLYLHPLMESVPVTTKIYILHISELIVKLDGFMCFLEEIFPLRRSKWYPF
jgi:hypothetical protein